MSFELLHFRGVEKILRQKNMEEVVKVTCEYINDVLDGTLHKGGLLRQALAECDWRENLDDLKILNGRRYCYKGYKNRIAIDGNFASYEAIWDSFLRLQIGWAKKKIDAGIVLVTGQRSEKTPYGSTKELIEKELELLYPTISIPVGVAIFNLGKPGTYLEAETKPDTASTKKGVQSKGSLKEIDKPRDTMTEKLDKLKAPPFEKSPKPKRKRKFRSLSAN